MKTSFAAVFGVLLCLVLTSCMTESAQPISSPATAVPDHRFIGDWRGGAEGDDEIYRFTPGKGAWMHVTNLPDPSDKSSKFNRRVGEYADAFPSVIGKNTFLNVRLINEDGRPGQNYLLIRYKFSHGDRRIRMWTMSQDGPVAAIEAGKLKGKIIEDRFSKNVLLQDTSANILKFIQKADLGELFDEELEPLRRVISGKK